MYIKFLTLVFLDFVYMLRYGDMVVEYGFVDVLLSLIYGFCWFYWYNAYSTSFTYLFFILMHCTMCCVVHTMFMIKCPLDVFVSLWIPLSTKFVGIVMFL